MEWEKRAELEENVQLIYDMQHSLFRNMKLVNTSVGVNDFLYRKKLFCKRARSDECNTNIFVSLIQQ